MNRGWRVFKCGGGGGGGGGNRAPKIGVGMGGGKGSIDRHHSLVSMNSGIQNGQFFFTKYMASDDFSEPPRHADSKNPIFMIFFLPIFGVWVTSEARGSVSLGF